MNSTRSTPRGRAESWALVLLVLSSLGLQLFRLDWGLPNWRRSLLIFGSKERIETTTPLLISLREAIYAPYRDVAIDTMPGQPGPGEAISRAMAYNGMRGNLLQPRSTDEQEVIGALSRMKQALKDRRFPTVVYGYFFPFLVGLALLLARGCGLLTLTSDIGFYLLHPGQVAGIYVAGRLVGASAALAAAAVLYWLARRHFGWKTAAVAALLFSWHPLCVVSAHYIKPWTCAALFDCALLHFCLNIAEGSRRRRDYWAAGILCGLAGGAAYLYALNWFWILFAQLHATGRKRAPRELSPLVQSAVLGAAVFFAANPQILFYFGDIVRKASADKVGTPQAGYLIQGIGGMFRTFPGILYVPALGLAALSARGSSKGNETYLWLIVCPSILLYGALMGQSAQHLLPIYPALCLLAACGLTGAWEAGGPGKIPAAVLSAALLGTSAGASSVWLRDAGSDNLERAGAWVAEHIRPGSSIGINRPVPDANFVPFPYADYRLTFYPHDRAGSRPGTDYVIDVGDPASDPPESPEFRRDYRLAYSLPRGWYVGLPTPLHPFAPYGAANVEIWSRSK